jgi:hypothetical protein
MFLCLAALAGGLTFLSTASAYTWPSPQLDALEAARFDQFGINAASTLTFAGFIQPCDRFFSSDTGRSDAADWIRTVRILPGGLDEIGGKLAMDPWW